MRKLFSRKLICLAIIFNIIILPTPGIVRQLVTQSSYAIDMTVASVQLVYALSNSIFGSTATAQHADRLEGRLSSVAHVSISPIKLVGYSEEGAIFTALPTDYLDRTIQGVKFTWESSDPDKIQIDDAGRARFLKPGLASITCRAGTAQASAPVLIKPNHRPVQSDADWRIDQNALTATGTVNSGKAALLIHSLTENFFPSVHAQGTYSGTDFAYDQLWSESRNLTGSPSSRAIETTAMGAVMPEGSNFNTAIPIYNLGGRGISTNLVLYYNSRVWARHGSAVTFDPVASWPSPGFSLGFGRIVVYEVGFGSNPNCKFMYVEPNGTRHYLGSGTWNGTGYAHGGPLETTDGSHIVYTGNARDGGDLFYSNGTMITFSTINNRLLPTTIYDTNGNYIQITYKPDCFTDQSGTHCGTFPPAALDFVTDSLGRKLEFQYDSTGHLTSITAPGFGGTVQNPVTQTLAQFDYQARTLSYNFSGLTVEHTAAFDAIRHIYFPATNTGYMFTYSSYGMIYNYSARRQMSSSSWPPGNPPSITDGVESANTTLNYPTSAGSALTDVPVFTQRTESAVNSPTATYTYSTSINTLLQTMTYTITRPDATTLALTRSTNSAIAANGRLTQSEIRLGSISLGKTVLTHANDGGNSPQVQSVIVYDDTGSSTKVDYDYDQYGNITNKREYGYQISGAWQVRRRTHYTYSTSSGYINLYLRGLVTLVEMSDAQQNTNDADDVLIAKNSCVYDNYAATGGMEDYGGTANPTGHLLGYNTTVTIRGNVTGVSEWIDLQAGTTITHLAKIDIFGNVVKAQVSCCQEKDLTITDNTYWSQPDSVMSGDPNGVHEMTSTDYDFNTSLTKSSTNAAGLVTNIGYDAMLRPSNVTLPTGASAQTDMNYGTLSSSSTVSYDEGGVTKTITSSTQYDGWGRLIQTVAPNNTQVNTAYDSMGRVISRTNPFAAGGTPGPATTIQYDIANKATITTLPDGNTVRSDHLGNTATVTDQVNRKTKRESDGLGRLVKVTEQDMSGALVQETSYGYNLLNNLILVNQGSQTRSYKYDAMGRLLFERIPEQSATINDGTGTYWSCKYTYTEFNAVLTKQDARGVITTNSYDSLHRVNSISYDVTNAPSVAQTGTVNLGYSASGKLLSASIPASTGVGEAYREDYTYDDFDRVETMKRYILGQSYDSRKSYTASYEYNQASQLTKITYPSGQQVSVNHDSKGRTQSLTYNPGDTTGYLTGVTYNTAGQVSGLTLGNGVVETYGYDTNRLQMTSQTATKGATTLMSLTYSYQAISGQMGAGTTAGNAGQLTAISGSLGGQTETVAYNYDLVGRLATSYNSSNGSVAARRYNYDRWGNRVEVVDPNTLSQLQSVVLQQSGGVPTNRVASVTSGGSTVNYTYDAAGNVTNDGVHSYVYDAENRLVSMDSGAAQYRYDHKNRRVCKIVGSAQTHYIWEGNHVVSEHDATTAYTTNPTYQVNSARVDRIYSGSRLVYDRQRASSGGAWTSYYHLSDKLSTRVVTDTNGNLVGRQAHLPFGEDFAESGVQEKHHITNYMRDAESGLDYAINRGYAASVGRFLQADPYRASGYMVDPQSWNRYSYTRNNPVNRIDPLGLDDTEGESDAPRDMQDVESSIQCYTLITGRESTDTYTFCVGTDKTVKRREPREPVRSTSSIFDMVQAFFKAKPHCRSAFASIDVTGMRTNGTIVVADLWAEVVSLSSQARFINTGGGKDPTANAWASQSFQSLGLTPPRGVPEETQLWEVLNIRSMISAVAFSNFKPGEWYNTVFFGSNWVNTKSEYERQAVFIHELMHLSFQADHAEIVGKLGITLGRGVPDTDQNFSDAMQAWLKKDCPSNFVYTPRR